MERALFCFVFLTICFKHHISQLLAWILRLEFLIWMESVLNFKSGIQPGKNVSVQLLPHTIEVTLIINFLFCFISNLFLCIFRNTWCHRSLWCNKRRIFRKCKTLASRNWSKLWSGFAILIYNDNFLNTIFTISIKYIFTIFKLLLALPEG